MISQESHLSARFFVLDVGSDMFLPFVNNKAQTCTDAGCDSVLTPLDGISPLDFASFMGLNTAASLSNAAVSCLRNTDLETFWDMDCDDTNGAYIACQFDCSVGRGWPLELEFNFVNTLLT